MIHGIVNLSPGSILFYKTRSFLSILSEILTGFQYDRVAIYLGKNQVLDTDFWGKLVVNPVSKYLSKEGLTGVTVPFLTEPADVRLFLSRVRRLKRDKLPIKILLGRALEGLGATVSEKPSCWDLFNIIYKW